MVAPSTHMYHWMAAEAQENLQVVIPEGIELNEGEILADYIQRMRDKQDTECELNSILAQVDHSLNPILLDTNEFLLGD